MTPIVPRIAIFSFSPLKTSSFTTSNSPPWFAKGFEVHSFTHPVSSDILANNRFNLLVYIGNAEIWATKLTCNIPLLYVNEERFLTGDLIYSAYSTGSLLDFNPKVSIFTPAHKTFEKFDRLHKTVLEQSFTDWEWIILDDTEGYENYNHMVKVAGSDNRIKIYKANRTDALVGSTKRQAASLCSGDILIEVDHDDELHHLALELCVDAFRKYPDAGFCYSDAAEVFETGGCVDYGPGFAMGEGMHYETYYKGRRLNPAITPINSCTLRHIVGSPNHFRAWKRDVYHAIQKHNNKLAIVDDYELLTRTFLHTKMIHIPQVLYVQYMNAGGNNTQEPRRHEIQRLVDSVQKFYDKKVHDRILELGGEDWMWDETKRESDLGRRASPYQCRSTLAYEYKI